MQIVSTRLGLPAAWECGGGATTTGEVQVIAGPQGERLLPCYINRRGSLSCADHALFVVKEGFLIISANHHRGDFRIRVERIRDILPQLVEAGEPPCFDATMELLAEFDRGEWSFSDIRLMRAGVTLSPGTYPERGTTSACLCGATVINDSSGRVSWATSDKSQVGELCSECEALLALEPCHNYSSSLLGAVEAAQKKALCYHCREPHYVKAAAPVAA